MIPMQENLGWMRFILLTRHQTFFTFGILLFILENIVFTRILFSLLITAFSATPSFSMEEGLPYERTHIAKLTDDALSAVFSSAVSDGTAPKTLSLVCRKWHEIVHRKQINEQLANLSGRVFQIDLDTYATKEEALAALDKQIPLHVSARTLILSGSSKDASPHNRLMPTDIFPSWFQEYTHLTALKIKGALDIAPFTNGMPDGADPSTLPDYHLLKNLKNIDIQCIYGEHSLVTNFLYKLIPTLPHLEQVALGTSVYADHLLGPSEPFEAGFGTFEIDKIVKYVNQSQSIKDLTLYHNHENSLFDIREGTKLISVYSYGKLQEGIWSAHSDNPHTIFNVRYMERLNKGQGHAADASSSS